MNISIWDNLNKKYIDKHNVKYIYHKITKESFIVEFNNGRRLSYSTLRYTLDFIFPGE